MACIEADMTCEDILLAARGDPDPPISYFLDYDGEEVIDAGSKGNQARFANHSCDPNCKIVRWKLAEFEEWQVRSRRIRV